MKEWTTKKIEDICDRASSGIAQNKIEGLSGEYPIYGASGYIQNVDFYHRDAPYVGIVKDGSGVGRVNTYPAFSSLLGTMQYIIPRNGYSLGYIAYALKSLRLSSFATGAAIPHIYFRDYGKCKIPVPTTLAEQEWVVAELDLLAGIIDKQKRQLAELDTLAQSIFYDMFGDPVVNEKGWEVRTFGDIGTLKRGSGLSKKDLIDEGYPCILYGQVHTRFGAYTEKHISCIPDDLISTAKIAHPGDLIMAITSEDVEGSCKSTAWLGKYDIAVGSDAAIFGHNQDGIYLSYYTRTVAFFNEKSKYARGFKVTHISTKEIETIPVMLPPIDLQKVFSTKIKFIESQKASIKRSIAESQKLFDYTMDKYFG